MFGGKGKVHAEAPVGIECIISQNKTTDRSVGRFVTGSIFFLLALKKYGIANLFFPHKIKKA
jgi:hypothetical protein